MKFTFTIPKSTINKAYQQVLTQATKDTKAKGFRAGKAPKHIVEEQVGKQKLISATVELALPQVYNQEIKKRSLKPITTPKITAKSLVDGKDWEFEAEIAQMPEVKLGAYKKEVKAALAKEKIWTPDKAKKIKPEEKTETSDNKKLNLVIDTLLKTASIDIPKLLVEEEVNRMLTRLLGQIEKLGLTIDQYLKSVNKTKETLRQEYQKQATESLKVELILLAVTDDLKIKVSEKDLDDLIAKVGDEKEKARLKQSDQRESVRFVLRKQKTLSKLMQL